VAVTIHVADCESLRCNPTVGERHVGGRLQRAVSFVQENLHTAALPIRVRHGSNYIGLAVAVQVGCLDLKHGELPR
jgi:hypothetical protein